MPSDLKSLSILCFSILSASFLFKLAFKEQETFRWAKCWLLLVAVAALTTNIWLIYISVVFLCLAMFPKEANHKVFFYLILLSALPQLPFRIPFPGINYLFELRYSRLLTIVVLIPIFLQQRKNPALSGNLPLDKLVLAYCIISTVLDFRLEQSPTFWARISLMTFIDIWVPYYIISRPSKNTHRYLLAILYGGIVLAVEGVIEWRLTWKSYAMITAHIEDIQFNRILSRNFYRGLGLRISTSWFGPIPFGAFMASMLYLVLNCHLIGKQRNFWVYVSAGFIFLALLFTDSRGAILLFIVAALVGLYFRFSGTGWKAFYKACALVGVLVAYIGVDMLLGVDDTGTFSYRLDLLINSADAISRNPLFGTPFYRQNAVLVETMTQGQGIVDIVNTYLRVLLQYGIVGLVPFAGAYLYTIKKMYSRVSTLERMQDERYKVGVILLSIISGLAVLIATVSPVSYLVTYSWIFIALASGYLKDTAELNLPATSNTTS